MAEIDAIFAARDILCKPQGPSTAPVPQTDRKKKARIRKNRITNESPDNTQSPPPSRFTSGDPAQSTRKRSPPQIVFDPSFSEHHVSKKSKYQSNSTRDKRASSTKSSKLPRNEVDHSFLDSRGSRSRRKTEEGFSIYKEHELGLSDKGGDTPLCPFDCQCCF